MVQRRGGCGGGSGADVVVLLVVTAGKQVTFTPVTRQVRQIGPPWGCVAPAGCFS